MINQRATAEASEANEQFKQIFQTNPDISLITRLSDGLIIETNAGFSATTGYHREDIIGKTTNEIQIYKNQEDRQRIVHELNTRGFLSQHGP